MPDPTRPCSYCNGSGVEPDSRAIGMKFRERRKKLGITLRAIADKCGVTPGHISDLERGNRRWQPATQNKYEEALKR